MVVSFKRGRGSAQTWTGSLNVKPLLSAVAAVAVFVSMGVGSAEARNRAVVNQWGVSNAAGAVQHGDRNGAVVNQTGGGHYSRGVQEGYDNFLRMAQYGTRNHVTTTQMGEANFSATGQ